MIANISGGGYQFLSQSTESKNKTEPVDKSKDWLTEESKGTHSCQPERTFSELPQVRQLYKEGNLAKISKCLFPQKLHK